MIELIARCILCLVIVFGIIAWAIMLVNHYTPNKNNENEIEKQTEKDRQKSIRAAKRKDRIIKIIDWFSK